MRNGGAIRMIAVMNTSITQSTPSEGSTVWARSSAVIYDPFLCFGERAGVRALRKELVGQARGYTVEIGSCTGLNLPHFPDDRATAQLIAGRARKDQR